jgi:hypothetical protein
MANHHGAFCSGCMTTIFERAETPSDVEDCLEIADEDAHVGITIFRIAFEAFEEGFFQGGGNVRIDLAWGDEVEGAVELFAENFLGCVAWERFLAGEQFERGDAIGEDIHTMIDRFMADLLGSHVGGGAWIARHFSGFVGLGLGEIKIDEAQVSVAGKDDIFGFEVQMHEPAFVDMLEGQGHVDEDIADMVGQDRIAAGAQELEIGALDIFHEEEEIALDLAMGDVGDDEFMVMNPGEDFATPNEAPFGDEIEAEIMVEAPECVRIALSIGGQPDIGHAAAVDEFLQVIGAELSGLGQCSFAASDFSE